MVIAVTDILQKFLFLFIVFHVVCIIIYTLHCILTFIISPLNAFVCSASRKYEPVRSKKHLNNFGKIYLCNMFVLTLSYFSVQSSWKLRPCHSEEPAFVCLCQKRWPPSLSASLAQCLVSFDTTQTLAANRSSCNTDI